MAASVEWNGGMEHPNGILGVFKTSLSCNIIVNLKMVTPPVFLGTSLGPLPIFLGTIKHFHTI